MPTWDAANELKLAAAIIALRQIKLSQGDCERLAAVMGDGCTAKAITHRLGKFRGAASGLDLGGGNASPTTPPTGRKRTRKVKPDGDQKCEGEDATPSKKARTTKPKLAPAGMKMEDGEGEGEGEGKVKCEAVEDD